MRSKYLLILCSIFFATALVAEPTLNDATQPTAPSDQQDLSASVSQLQQTVKSLRGLVEAQGQEIQKLKQKDQPTTPPESDTTPVQEFKSLTTPTISTDSAPTTAAPDKETQIYQAAYAHIDGKHYSDAISGFEDYLQQYPKGQYVANAHYWLGQLYMTAGQNDDAKANFLVIVNRYASSNKTADAMLQLGVLAYHASEWADARMWWQKVEKQYPNSGAARIATGRLTELQQAGN